MDITTGDRWQDLLKALGQNEYRLYAEFFCEQGNQFVFQPACSVPVSKKSSRVVAGDNAQFATLFDAIHQRVRDAARCQNQRQHTGD